MQRFIYAPKQNPMTSSTAQALLTGGLVTIAFALVVLAARDVRAHRSGRILIALAISVGLGYLALLPGWAEPRSTLAAIGRVAGLPATGFAWWFAWSLLDDRFRIGAVSWLGLVAASLFPAYYALIDFGISIPRLPAALTEIGLIPPLLICAHCFWLALGGYRDDLIPNRRRARIWIVVLLALGLILVLVSEEMSPAAGGILRAATSLFVAFLLLLWLVETNSEALALVEPAAPAAPEKVGLDPRDALAYERLKKAMSEERIYLQADLTMGDLAKRVGVPEHQLRVLINRGLGERNFSTYIAKARIECAKLALADPEKSRTQIVRIAMDAGFPSLATFNRSFKAIEGITPSEFRAKTLQNTA
jgi:AraC-like DNA-binding protein